MHQSTAILATEQGTLADLAVQINAAHVNCEKAIQSALSFARDCGMGLLAAKRALKHGDFATWIGQNCRFSERMARRYMTIAGGWQQLLDLSKRTHVSDLNLDSLSVREALRILSAGGPETRDPIYLDKTCPSCGERLVVSSKLYATCPACWNCRLYGIHPNTIAHGPKPRGAQGTLNAWHAIPESRVKADVLIHLLASLDADTLRWLKDGLSQQQTAPRTAAERIMELAGQEATP